MSPVDSLIIFLFGYHLALGNWLTLPLFLTLYAARCKRAYTATMNAGTFSTGSFVLTRACPHPKRVYFSLRFTSISHLHKYACNNFSILSSGSVQIKYAGWRYRSLEFFVRRKKCAKSIFSHIFCFNLVNCQTQVNSFRSYIFLEKLNKRIRNPYICAKWQSTIK